MEAAACIAMVLSCTQTAGGLAEQKSTRLRFYKDDYLLHFLIVILYITNKVKVKKPICFKLEMKHGNKIE